MMFLLSVLQLLEQTGESGLVSLGVETKGDLIEVYRMMWGIDSGNLFPRAVVSKIRGQLPGARVKRFRRDLRKNYFSQTLESGMYFPFTLIIDHVSADFDDKLNYSHRPIHCL